MITMKRTFSIILAVFMLLSAIPFTASAAEPITLMRDNITQWPTVTNKDGSEPKVQLYAGQRFDEAWALKGGEVRYDVNENGELEENEIVPGTFVFYDERALNGDSYIQISFIPDDETAYTRIENVRNGESMGSVGGVTYVVPEIIELPAATEVESGARLSTSTISGGKVIHPVSGEEITYGTWAWTSKRTKVTDSGYHEVEFFISPDFEILTAKIYVRIVGDTADTKTGTIIGELPTIEKTHYIGEKWENVKLVGGKAVDDVNGLEVPGTFTINKTGTITTGGTYDIEVKFTPDDSNTYSGATGKIEITVEKNTVKFVDENGNDIIPEIELGYNTKDLQYNLSEIKNLLKPYANCGEENFYCNWQDLENKDLPYRKDSLEVNTTKEYIIRGLSYDSDNYAPAMLTFRLKVVPRKLTATVRYTGNSISVDTTKPLTDKLYGTFEYYANGEKIGTSQITTTSDSTGLQWKPEKSGVYDITVKFVLDEKDVYYFDDTTVEDMEIICAWGVTVENGTVKVSNSYKESGRFKYGEDVSVQSKTNASFSHWIVTDTKGNEIEIEGFDVNKSYNTFKMPDFSVNFKAVDLTQRRINCTNCFVKNAVGSADAPIRYKGQKVSIGIDEAALPLEKFAGWEITDSNGDAYMPEGLTEEALAGTNIEFTMPDFDITVKAKNVDDEKGDGFFAQVKAFFENLFNGETECPVLKWIIKVFNAIVNFFTGLFVK